MMTADRAERASQAWAQSESDALAADRAEGDGDYVRAARFRRFSEVWEMRARELELADHDEDE